MLSGSFFTAWLLLCGNDDIKVLYCEGSAGILNLCTDVVGSVGGGCDGDDFVGAESLCCRIRGGGCLFIVDGILIGGCTAGSAAGNGDAVAKINAGGTDGGQINQ